MSTDLPQYGIKTCGKLLDPPFDALGPCLLKPGHTDKCMVQAPGIRGGLLNVSQVDGGLPQLKDHPWYSDEEVLRYRRISRRLFRGSMAAFALNMVVCAWTLLRAFHVL
jgi:hypothetical protein